MENTDSIRVVVEHVLGSECEKISDVVAAIEAVIAETQAVVEARIARTRARLEARGETMEPWDETTRYAIVQPEIRKRFFDKMQQVFGSAPVTVNGRTIDFCDIACTNGLEDMQFYAQALYMDPRLHDEVESLQTISREQGYKPGWVWYRLSERYGKLVAGLLA